MLKIWMILRYLKNDRRGRLTLALSLLGMSFGVAALVLSMAIVSGYESTLRRSVIDSFGHLILLKKGIGFKDKLEFSEEFKGGLKEVKAVTPFLLVEGLLVQNKQLGGVVLEGVDLNTHSQVINMKKHIVAGEFDLQPSTDNLPRAVVGKGVQKKFKLKIGDTFRVVIPFSHQINKSSEFKTRLQKFVLSGVVDMGRHDFDERYVLTELSTAQAFAQLGSRVSGYRVRLYDELQAEKVKLYVDEKWGYPFVVQTWFDSNRNVFMAAQFEKIVIFIIVLLMVIAASFNISGTLYVTVLKRYHDISILKAIGADQKFLYRLFAFQGVVVGFLGAVIGIALGYSICELFMVIQRKFPLFPAEIYKIDLIQTEVQMRDLALILFSSIFVCFLASLRPARKGSELEAVEGLRYE